MITSNEALQESKTTKITTRQAEAELEEVERDTPYLTHLPARFRAGVR